MSIVFHWGLMFLKTWNVCLLRMIYFLTSPCPQRISLCLVYWCSGTASFLTPPPVSRGASFFVFNGWTASLYLTIMLIMSSCDHLRNTCLAPSMFLEHVSAISDMATRDVAKKKLSRLRYPLSRLTLEGACAFCVGAADTGGWYGRGWPPPIGGVRGASPGKFWKFEFHLVPSGAIWGLF